MATVLTNDQHYTDIASAIREKTGSNSLLKPEEMAEAIENISTGTLIPSSALVLPWDCGQLCDPDSSKCSHLWNYLLLNERDIARRVDSSKVIYMSAMFIENENFTNSWTTENFDTSNVITMEGMFAGCTNITSIDLSSFNTSKVTNMAAMFSACGSLEAVDVSHFDMSNVKDIGGMFMNCHSLRALDLSTWNTSKVTSMVNLFTLSELLESINLGSLSINSVVHDDSRLGFYNNCSLKEIIIEDDSRLLEIYEYTGGAWPGCYHFLGQTHEQYNPQGLKDGKIYVPDSVVTAYKNANGWSEVADCIYPLSTRV